MTEQDRHDIVLTTPAIRAIRSGLPEAVSAAAIELVTGALLGNPRRVGEQLRHDLAGVYSARRGTYRVLLRLDDQAREVVVLGIEHRAHACRPR